MKSKQLKLLKQNNKAYGGELQKTRKGRQGPRPLDTKNSIHMVLRSSKAKGAWSFNRPENHKKIKRILENFSKKYGISIISLANVGNHLHLHIKLSNRYTYKPFIRAITSAIAMAVTGRSRWNKEENIAFTHPRDQIWASKHGNNQSSGSESKRLKFWDYRPFTRVIQGFKSLLTLNDYIKINQLEGFYGRQYAQLIIKGDPYIDRLLSG